MIYLNTLFNIEANQLNHTFRDIVSIFVGRSKSMNVYFLMWAESSAFSAVKVPSISSEICVPLDLAMLYIVLLASFILFLESCHLTDSGRTLKWDTELQFTITMIHVVRDYLPLYPLFISAICGLGSEILFMKKPKIHDTARYRASDAREAIKPLHSVPAACNTIKGIFIYSIMPITMITPQF